MSTPLDNILDGMAERLAKAICAANQGSRVLSEAETAIQVRNAMKAAKCGFTIGGASVVVDFGNGLQMSFGVSSRGGELVDFPQAAPAAPRRRRA